MDIKNLINSLPSNAAYKVKQPRLWILVNLVISDQIKETKPALELIGINGQYLLGFNFPPQIGEYFPYEGHIWQVINYPIQFPTRYKTSSVKKSPLLFAKYIETCENDTQLLERLLELQITG
jgi:hypothetical protein